MIHYDLRCSAGHTFDGWFASAAGFDTQAAAGFVECPTCGTTAVTKALMTPAVPKKGRPARAAAPAGPPPKQEPPAAPAVPSRAAAGPVPAQLVAMLQRMRVEVEKNCDYVGKDFATEARRMHEGESERRGIYGEATDAEAEALKEEGIEVNRIPWVPPADA